MDPIIDRLIEWSSYLNYFEIKGEFTPVMGEIEQQLLPNVVEYFNKRVELQETDIMFHI